jgi:hypothetical protein
MMRNILKWLGIILGSLVGLVVLAAIILYIIGGVIWNRTYENYDVSVEAVTIPTGEAAIAHGRHVATTIFVLSAMVKIWPARFY